VAVQPPARVRALIAGSNDSGQGRAPRRPPCPIAGQPTRETRYLPLVRDEFRLAELMAAISLATDLGMGQPLEQALRTCLLAVGLGERLGLAGESLSDVL
jgi:hypothetical protein